MTSYDLTDIRQRPSSAESKANPVQRSRLITSIDYAPVAELLISRGARVNARATSRRFTPLHLAARMGHQQVAASLLRHGADVKATDDLGLAALDMTAMTGNVAMARLLLQHGATPNARVSAAGSLQAFADETPLSLAVVCNQGEFVEFLLALGADPKQPLKSGFTALHLASSPDVARVLLDHGARVNDPSYEGRTPLCQAVMQGRPEVAALLLERGADLEAKDRNGSTPLLTAINATYESGMKLQLVTLLLGRGAQVNACDGQSHTPLYYASGGTDQDQRIAAVLRSHGGIK